MIEVSIVIVCMNNLDNLYPCLQSIKKHTSLTFEVFVVAYLFSIENLKKVREDFPWVIFIESNQIRGFSENNNLALKKTKGEYCFILNDDTKMKMPVIDVLVNSIKNLPSDVAIISPVTLNRDGSVQRCGRCRYNFGVFLLSLLGLRNIYEKNSKYTNGQGVFQTFNISGACFLIKRKVFEEMGWFDERYFFCPEDVALSTLINRRGYKCFVDADVQLYHLCGGTWSKTVLATKPASAKGMEIFFSDEGFLIGFFYRLLAIVMYLFKALCWALLSICNNPQNLIKMRANYHAFIALLGNKSPKELFELYYEKVKRS